MSRFYGSLEAPGRKPVTKGGHPATGLTGHVRGWNVGVEVGAHDEDGQDVFTIFTTYGSKGRGHHTPIGTVRLNSKGVPIFKRRTAK